MASIDVRCDGGRDDGWLCTVTVREGDRVTVREYDREISSHRVRVSAADLDRLIGRARDLLRRSVATSPGGMPMAVYRRAGRPCRRCRTLVRSAPLAAAIPRTTYWCPACQPDERSDDGIDRRPV